MRKIILTAFFAVAALSITSCNKMPEPIIDTPQATFALSVANLMRNGLFTVFAYEEVTNAKVSSGGTLDNGVTLIKDGSDNVIGWKTNLIDHDFFGGKIIVEYEPLTDGAVRHINCSEMTIQIPQLYVNLKLFGNITVEDRIMSATETVHKITTNSFGWGETANDISLEDVDYTFNCKWNAGGQLNITECKISGESLGHHSKYLNFSQIIDTEMSVGSNRFFTSGVMILYANIGDGIKPIYVEFTSNSVIVKYKDETETIY